MSSAIGGGEAASALAGAVIFAVNLFVAGFPVDDPCLLFESAVEVVRANGRAAFTVCNAEFRYGSPAGGRSCPSSPSVSTPPIQVAPSSPRAPRSALDAAAAGAVLSPADAAVVEGRPRPAVPPVAGGPAVPSPPRGAAGSNATTTSSSPARSARTASPLPPFASWAHLLRRAPHAPAAVGPPPASPQACGAVPAAAAASVGSRDGEGAPWTLVVRRRRRRGASPPAPADSAPSTPAALPRAPARGQSHASAPPSSGASPPVPAASAAFAVAALTRHRRGAAPPPDLTTIYVAGVSREARSHRLRSLVAAAVGLAPAAVVDVDRFGASAAVTILSSAAAAFRAGLEHPSVAGVLWEVADADPWAPAFLGGRRRAQLSGPAAATEAATLCRRRLRAKLDQLTIRTRMPPHLRGALRAHVAALLARCDAVASPASGSAESPACAPVRPAVRAAPDADAARHAVALPCPPPAPPHTGARSPAPALALDRTGVPRPRAPVVSPPSAPPAASPGGAPGLPPVDPAPVVGRRRRRRLPRGPGRGPAAVPASETPALRRRASSQRFRSLSAPPPAGSALGDTSDRGLTPGELADLPREVWNLLHAKPLIGRDRAPFRHPAEGGALPAPFD